MRWLPSLAILVGCSRSGSAPDTTGLETTTTATDPCSPAALKLPTAVPLVEWKPPAGCTVIQSAETKILRTAADAAASIDCKGAELGVDFATSAIVVSQRQLSPASVGIFALDDGTTLTFVSRFRPPCPDDPRPMPAPLTLIYKLDAGDRRFGEATCTIKRSCR